MRGFFLVVLVAAACGGIQAEAPLTIQLGLSHGAAEHALHDHQFCHKRGRIDATHEVYPRCDRTAAEESDVWVNAIFDGDRLIELRRWERFSDDDRALQRWNQLIAARMKTSTPSEEALAKLREKGLLQPGTRAVKAFRGDDDTVIGVYLLTPTSPENASVLEKITYANAK